MGIVPINALLDSDKSDNCELTEMSDKLPDKRLPDKCNKVRLLFSNKQFGMIPLIRCDETEPLNKYFPNGFR